MRDRLSRLGAHFGALGLSATLSYLFHRQFPRQSRSEFWIRPKGVDHAVCVRQPASDMRCFNQIFVEREYGALDDLADVRLVIDCGANVGYASAYLLSHHPQSKVIAVEPDSGNFAQLRSNLKRYGDRVQLIRAGVWSHTVGLVLSEVPYRDGLEWTRQVRPSKPDEGTDLQGVDIASLLAQSGHERISLLKMDIEGAEAVVFAANYESWLTKVDAIAIELHDDSSFGKGSDVFFSAIEGRDFQVTQSGELTICRSRSARG